jgi:hypothetical protein
VLSALEAIPGSGAGLDARVEELAEQCLFPGGPGMG